jgi:integrase
LTIVNGRYPRHANSSEYASTNGTSGPVTRTPSTLLDGLDITASFSDNKKDNDRQTGPRYADIYAAINPACKALLPNIGITKTSAYSWLCRRRHNHDLRHTFGTRMAAEGVPMRVLQEMMGHRDFKTTLIYADYSPSEHEAEWVEQAFRPSAANVVDAVSPT